MKNIRITFEIPAKILEQLKDREGFIKNIDNLKENRLLSPYLVNLIISDYEKIETINIETEKIAKLVSKELINELGKLNINVTENHDETKENAQINLNEEKLNKLKQLS